MSNIEFAIELCKRLTFLLSGFMIVECSMNVYFKMQRIRNGHYHS